MHQQTLSDKQVAAAGKALKVFMDNGLSPGDTQVALMMMILYAGFRLEIDHGQMCKHFMTMINATANHPELMQRIMSGLHKEATEGRIVVPVGVNPMPAPPDTKGAKPN